MTNYTRDHMETACCLWEAMLEQREKLPELDRAWLRYGTNEMRHAAIDMATEVNAQWQAMSEAEREDFDTFDWDFCPVAIRTRDWAQFQS